MAQQNIDATILKLAEAEQFYREGVAALLEDGMAQDELDDRLEQAGEELQARADAKGKRVKTRRALRAF